MKFQVKLLIGFLIILGLIFPAEIFFSSSLSQKEKFLKLWEEKLLPYLKKIGEWLKEKILINIEPTIKKELEKKKEEIKLKILK